MELVEWQLDLNFVQQLAECDERQKKFSGWFDNLKLLEVCPIPDTPAPVKVLALLISRICTLAIVCAQRNNKTRQLISVFKFQKNAELTEDIVGLGMSVIQFTESVLYVYRKGGGEDRSFTMETLPRTSGIKYVLTPVLVTSTLNNSYS
jgi:hypothetical protein